MADFAAQIAAQIARDIGSGLAAEHLGLVVQGAEGDPVFPVIAANIARAHLNWNNPTLSGLTVLTAIAATVGPWVHYGSPVPYYGKLNGRKVAQENATTTFPAVIISPHTPMHVFTRRSAGRPMYSATPTLAAPQAGPSLSSPTPSFLLIESTAANTADIDNALLPSPSFEIRYSDLPLNDRGNVWIAVLLCCVFCVGVAATGWLKVLDQCVVPTATETKDDISRITAQTPTKSTNNRLELDQIKNATVEEEIPLTEKMDVEENKLLFTGKDDKESKLLIALAEKKELKKKLPKVETKAILDLASTTQQKLLIALAEKQELEKKLRQVETNATLNIAIATQQKAYWQSQSEKWSQTSRRWEEDFEEQCKLSRSWEALLNGQEKKTSRIEQRLETVSIRLAALRKVKEYRSGLPDNALTGFELEDQVENLMTESGPSAKWDKTLKGFEQFLGTDIVAEIKTMNAVRSKNKSKFATSNEWVNDKGTRKTAQGYQTPTQAMKQDLRARLSSMRKDLEKKLSYPNGTEL